MTTAADAPFLFRVCYSDTDAAGVVYHARYLEMFERSQQVAIIFSAALGYILNEFMSKEMVAEWGWRILKLIIFIYY